MEEMEPSQPATAPPAKKPWLWVAIAVVIILIIAVVAIALMPGVTPPPSAVTVVGPWAGSEADAFMPVLAAFTAATGIEVEYQNIRQEDLQTILPTQFAAGEAPGDVIFMVSSFIQANGAAHGVEVSDLIDDADFIPGALDPVKVGDDVYGGVYTGKVKPGFWYRKSFFEQNNLQVPTTYTEFVNLLAQIDAISGVTTPIVSGDGVGWPLSDVTEHFIASYGGATMHRQLTAGQVAWTDASVRSVFADFLVPLLQANYFSEPLEWNTVALNNWWNGEHALYFMGSWITGMVDDPDDLGVFSLPPPSGTTTGIVFAGDFFFIPRYTDNLEGARALFSFLAGPQGQTVQVQQGGHIATAAGVALSAYPAVDLGVAQLMEDVEILADLDDTVGGDFQTNLWSQLQLLWVDPGALDSVLQSIQSEMPAS